MLILLCLLGLALFIVIIGSCIYIKILRTALKQLKAQIDFLKAFYHIGGDH